MAVTIPVLAKAQIGHFVEVQVLKVLGGREGPRTRAERAGRGAVGPGPGADELSAVCGRYRPTASRRPRANPSRARQWTLPLSTTSRSRATRSSRSRLHRGEPRRLSSKRPARDHQRLPCTEWCHAAACLASAFPHLSSAVGAQRNGTAAPDDNAGQSNDDFQR
jgi:hypothetical protein